MQQSECPHCGAPALPFPVRGNVVYLCRTNDHIRTWACQEITRLKAEYRAVLVGAALPQLEVLRSKP